MKLPAEYAGDMPPTARGCPAGAGVTGISAGSFQYVRLESMRLFYQIQEFVSGTLVFEEDSAEG